MKIAKVRALQILDSRGTPTIDVQLTSSNGKTASFSVPAGASKGENEAIELRDGATFYKGQGVTKAIQLIDNELAPLLTQSDIADQLSFDAILHNFDSSINKAKIGGNTALALSATFLKLSAAEAGFPIWQFVRDTLGTHEGFPRIFANLVNGGKHAPGLDIQEFMVVPTETAPASAIAQIYDFHAELQSTLEKKYGPTVKLTGDEGGMAPPGAKSEEILQAMSALRHDFRAPVDIALDVAASSFCKDDTYHYEGQSLTTAAWLETLNKLAESYEIFSIEDPAAETDRTGFTAAMSASTHYKVIGDDISVTSQARIKELADAKLISGVIIKPNQIGTISETFGAITTAREAGLFTIISHRSGETNDSLIVDIAYGVGAQGLKIGAPRRGERVAKYNRLLEIEQGVNL